MPDFMLSFEVDESGEVLKIHGDDKGLQSLANCINMLLANTKDGHFNHDHIMTPSWGGYELSEENMGEKVINHVKIYCWKGNELQR